MLKKLRNVLKSRKGQGLVEYGILVGGVALVCLVAVAILGHKANDLLAVTAGSLPGAHADDNGPIVSGKLVNTAQDTNGVIFLDGTDPGTLAGNLGIPGADQLSIEAEDLTP